MRIVETTYPVLGASLDELARAIGMLAPTRAGTRFAAYTDWTVSWRYRGVAAPGGFAVAELEVDAVATVTLPRWRPLRSVAPAVVARWTCFVDALRRHEAGHLAVVARTEDAVRAAIADVAAEPDLESLAHAVDAAAREVVRRAREEDRAYDEETRHGAAQGAGLPTLAIREGSLETPVDR
jgi:predicted secreted Zn-dependent protease